MSRHKVYKCRVCGWESETYVYDGFSHIKLIPSVFEHFKEEHPELEGPAAHFTIVEKELE